MKIKTEFFEIAKSATDEHGQKLEPEEQPALIIQNVEGGAPATIKQGSVEVGQIPLQIARATTAGDLATMRSRLCHHCKHWNRTAWLKLIRSAASGFGSPEELQAVNMIRSALLETNNAELSDQYESEDGGMDVEEALHSMGICGPLTEHERATDPNFGPKELVVTFPTACCPTEHVTPTQPYGLFVARDREARENAGVDKDAVLLATVGKERQP